MAQDNDLKSHEHTYSRMMTMFKYGTIAVVIIAALVVWLIS
ncbi:aa3-type cytochrome c oxidase subunit IV [uncultured Sphingomonas sp.]